VQAFVWPGIRVPGIALCAPPPPVPAPTFVCFPILPATQWTQPSPLPSPPPRPPLSLPLGRSPTAQVWDRIPNCVSAAWRGETFFRRRGGGLSPKARSALLSEHPKAMGYFRGLAVVTDGKEGD
jgi:hypothetical protein